MQPVIYLCDLFSFSAYYSHTFPTHTFVFFFRLLGWLLVGWWGWFHHRTAHIRRQRWQNSITCFSGTRIMCSADWQKVHAALVAPLSCAFSPLLVRLYRYFFKNFFILGFIVFDLARPHQRLPVVDSALASQRWDDGVVPFPWIQSCQQEVPPLPWEVMRVPKL